MSNFRLAMYSALLYNCNTYAVHIEVGRKHMLRRFDLPKQNVKLARRRWGAGVSPYVLSALNRYSREFRFSLERGDLLLLNGGWYVTNAGLVRLAQRRGCAGMQSE